MVLADVTSFSTFSLLSSPSLSSTSDPSDPESLSELLSESSSPLSNFIHSEGFFPSPTMGLAL